MKTRPMLDFRVEAKEIIIDMFRQTGNINSARMCALMAAERLKNSYPSNHVKYIAHYDLVLAEIPKVRLKEIK
jgi:protoporphyrinogen oxidase